MGKSKNESLGVVEKNKAAAELAQLKEEDPTPLRVAKITQEAVLRKVEKQKSTVEAVVKVHAEKKEALEKAYAELEKQMNGAIEALNRARNDPGSATAAIAWLDRVMWDADKYLPSSKQKFSHTSPFVWGGLPPVPDEAPTDLDFDD